MTGEASQPAGMLLRDFLETVQPGRSVVLTQSNFRAFPNNQAPSGFRLMMSPVSLFCGLPACGGVRVFEPDSQEYSIGWSLVDVFLDYTCRNCKLTAKTYAVRFTPGSSRSDYTRTALKFGEMPQFGPPLPAKLLQLAGNEGHILKKGRQSENQSLGVGAFAYYRRVVERQKSRLIDELKNAVERLGGDASALAALEAARKENQFATAIQRMAQVTPKELHVGGQNPLTLLHGPLSVGLHSLSDEECLKLAYSIRIVLSELLERIQMVTEVKAELDEAIKELIQPSAKGKSGKASS